jgi:hypothetical protein
MTFLCHSRGQSTKALSLIAWRKPLPKFIQEKRWVQNAYRLFAIVAFVVLLYWMLQVIHPAT